MGRSMVLVVTLMITGILLVIAEVFLPGAVAGVVGTACLLVGVVLAFAQSTVIGVATLATACIVGVAAFYASMKLMPKSSLGKKLFLSKTAKSWQGYDARLESLQGEYGEAETILHPGGIARIAGQRVDVVTQGAMLDRGQRLQVVEVRGNRVVVAAVPEESPMAAKPAPPDQPGRPS
jgi:membrane-bound serine protease (ClpP class)